MRGHHHHQRGPKGHPGYRRAMRARRWMKENPTNEEIIAMLEEHQRDLEQEVASVADRIRTLKDETATANA